MIHELIVTSVPRGLQAGRSGFTTVLRTRGIHPQLAEALERASGYRHVFPHGDPRNPQIRTHTVVTGAAGMVSVLSRIADAGSDYSGRSNKLAHHIALDAGETAARAKSNPAAVLLALERSGGFQRQWTGEPREQPAGPAVPAVPSEPGICQGWARFAGDAGWAGFLADRALARQPTWIIAPPGTDLLELFSEALALVNYPQRWGVTFTTYALSAGDAVWLGTVDGSPEAQAARGQSRLAVVDLVRRAPLTVTSPLIEAARGTAQVPWKRDVSRPAAAVMQPGMAAAGPLAAGPAVVGGAAPPTLAPGMPPTLAGGPPRLVPGGMPLDAPAAGDMLDLPAGSTGGRGRVPGGVWAGMVVALLLLVGGGVTAVVNPELLDAFRKEKPQEVASKGLEKRTDDHSDSDRKGPTGSVPPVGAGEPSGESGEPKGDDPPPAVGASPPGPSTNQAPPPRPDPALDRRRAFRDLKARLEQARHLPVAPLLAAGTDEGKPLVLCKVRGAEIELSLPNVSGFNPVANAPQWRLVLEGERPGQWKIVTTEDGPRHEIASIAVEDGTLSLTLLELPKDLDDAEICKRARVAALTLPLLLRLPDEPSAEFETHVQLCQPKRLDPIQIPKFLTDKEKKYRPKPTGKPGETIIHDPLPATPWECTVELEGGATEGITAAVVPGKNEPGVKKLADWFSPSPLALTAQWAWSGQEGQAAPEPFMETAFTLGNRAEDPSGLTGGALELQLTKSEVPEPWSGWKRLGALKEISSKPEPPTELPYPMPAVLERMPDGDQLKLNELAPYFELARQHLPKYNTQTSAEVRKTLEQVAGRLAQQKDLPQALPKSLAFWKEAIRVAVGATPGYLAWVQPKAPEPGQPPKPGKDGKLNPAEVKAWEQRKRAYDLFWNPLSAPQLTPIPEDKLKEFWQGLQAAPAEKKCEQSVMLCSLHFGIEEVLAEKREAKRLLEAVGDGTVEFTGRVWVDAMNNGQHRVLLAEFKADEPDDDSRADETPDKTKDAAPAGEAAAVAQPPAGPVAAEGDADRTGTQ